MAFWIDFHQRSGQVGSHKMTVKIHNNCYPYLKDLLHHIVEKQNKTKQNKNEKVSLFKKGKAQKFLNFRTDY